MLMGVHNAGEFIVATGEVAAMAWELIGCLMVDIGFGRHERRGPSGDLVESDRAVRLVGQLVCRLASSRPFELIETVSTWERSDMQELTRWELGLKSLCQPNERLEQL